MEKYNESHIRTINLKYHLQYGKKYLNYLMNHVLYMIFKVILKINDNKKPSIRIFVNKIKNRITFKIKTGYYLELLTPQSMKLLGSTKSKITKDENGKNLHNFEIADFVLVHCNTVNNNHQQNSRVLYTVVNKTSEGFVFR